MSITETINSHDKDLFTSNDVAGILQVSQWTVVNYYIKNNLLKAFKLNDRGQWRIWKEDLLAFIAERETNVTNREA